MKIYFIQLIFILQISIQAKLLDQDFQFSVTSPHLKYGLERKANYIRWTKMGYKSGFFINSCHTKYLNKISDVILKTTELWWSYPLNQDLKEQQDTILIINGKKKSVSSKSEETPGLHTLPRKISNLIKQADKSCKK